MEEIVNAKITKIAWSNEPVLTQYIYIEGSGFGCTLGGFCLKQDACYIWMNEITKFFDVYGEFQESQFVGQIVRIKLIDGRVYAIGDPIKDKWFCPKEFFAKYIGNK